MTPALIFVACFGFVWWLAYRAEGWVILDDAKDAKSVFALVVAALVLVFAFIIPDLHGHDIPRWRLRLFGTVPFCALVVVVFPFEASQASQIVFTSKGVRSIGIVLLVLFLLAALFT